VVPAVSEVRCAIATHADWPEVAALRHSVFVEEQRVPAEIEQDELDPLAVHAVARDDDGAVVGTGRVVIDGGGPGVARVGRMAVDARRRGEGIGAVVLDLLERVAKDRGSTSVLLHAQEHAIAFYAGAGYRPEGERFEEAGIGHLAMVKVLS
jgi:predicted GNAT family N-acyltransferase